MDQHLVGISIGFNSTGGFLPLGLFIKQFGQVATYSLTVFLTPGHKNCWLKGAAFSQIQNVPTVYYHGTCARPPPEMSQEHRFSHFYAGGHLPSISGLSVSRSPFKASLKLFPNCSDLWVPKGGEEALPRLHVITIAPGCARVNMESTTLPFLFLCWGNLDNALARKFFFPGKWCKVNWKLEKNSAQHNYSTPSCTGVHKASKFL